MKSWWQSYQSKSNQHQEDASIANDEVALLAERLQYFIPRYGQMLPTAQWLFYIFAWSVHAVFLMRWQMPGWSAFLVEVFFETLLNLLTIMPGVWIIAYLRPSFRYLDQFQACLRIWLVVISTGFIAVNVVTLLKIGVGWRQYTPSEYALAVIFHVVLVAAFTLAFLQYYLRRYRDLSAMKLSFEQKLLAQHDLIKARITPHFFFNTVNTLLALVETEPKKAADMLHHVSALFRSSFAEAKEISFEAEIQLCEHYLAIEKYRLGEKLKVEWQLPEEDMVYDLVITSLTLQRTVEQLLIQAVELTTERIDLKIDTTWVCDLVHISVSIKMPNNTLMVAHHLQRTMDFGTLQARLRQHFGDSAQITAVTEQQRLVAHIQYPLKDIELLGHLA